MDNETNNTSGDQSQGNDWEQARREREAAEDVEVNHPDPILDEDAEEDGNAPQAAPNPGDNLTEQHPTQDQTVGESGTSGFDDEAYSSDEETREGQ